MLGVASLVSFAAGAASVAAFAPLGAYPLALLSFAWLVHAWRGAPPPRAFFLGFWFGLGFFGAGVSWVYVSMHDIGGMPPPAGCRRAFPPLRRSAPACSSRRHGPSSNGCARGS